MQTTRMVSGIHGGIVFPACKFNWILPQKDAVELEKNFPTPPTAFAVCLLREATTPENTCLALAVGKDPNELKWFVTNITQRPPLDIPNTDPNEAMERVEKTLSMIYHNYFRMWDRTLVINSK